MSNGEQSKSAKSKTVAESIDAEEDPTMNVPQPWKSGTLQDVICSVRGGFSVQCEDRAIGTSEIGVLKTGAVLEGRFNPKQNKYVPPEEHARLRTPVSANTIIICRKNSAESIGASALVDRDYQGLFLSDLLWELKPATNADSQWLASVLQSDSVRSILRLWSTGTQSTMKNISQDRLLAIPINIPSKNEQKNIVAILRTWDEAIENVGCLIEKKTAAYAAESQHFFAPCHPAFTRPGNDLKPSTLGKLFNERAESGLESDALLSITMAGGVISQDEVGRRDSSCEDKSKYKLILPGDIGYNTMRMWQGVCGLSALRGIISPAYTVVFPIESEINARYAFHLFKSRRMIHDFERYSQGLTSDTWNLKYPVFSEIKVFIPDLMAQIAQANYLDAIKAEIEVLKRHAEALSRQKRGLMQKLLTGKWRVTV
jgi:type I restriction enzyme, S subunit